MWRSLLKPWLPIKEFRYKRRSEDMEQLYKPVEWKSTPNKSIPVQTMASAHMANCKNCGAPLHSLRCEYCGTDYKTPVSEGWEGKINIGGEEIHVYISCLENNATNESWRTLDGVLHRKIYNKRKITLIEI